ncbi:zinc finger protein [Cinnamomum micranthum f. kanehirae]|uniref:Zinc finger protein n=1 Tax=Cinnamomum micranthum f. kanehirae TaxID=337451 RepID=A0A443PMV2_9MAGN|nr:zinc finger protein [Cinnamomum micranthum f. kanehirae]
MATHHQPREEIEDGGHRLSIRSDEGSLCFSDAEESWHSNECRLSGVSDHQASTVSESDCCSGVDLESGDLKSKVHSGKAEKDCRICHLSLESTNQESGIPIELGCSCKDDLAAAHKQCAEAWFKIRGNKTCEICGSTARNVVTATEPEIVEQPSETSNAVATSQVEPRNFWRGHRFLNFLLACMVFAFAISWLFHFNVPS